MSSKIKKIGSLEIQPEAIRINPAFGKIQKIGIILMCLFLLGSLAGLFGPGIFGDAQIKNTEFEIYYPKFLRFQNSYSINFHLNHSSNNNNYIWINNAFFQKIYIQKIIPQPLLEESFNEGIRYTFPTQPNTSANIIFLIEPNKMGVVKMDARINNSETVKINQFIYP